MFVAVKMKVFPDQIVYLSSGLFRVKQAAIDEWQVNGSVYRVFLKCLGVD